MRLQLGMCLIAVLLGGVGSGRAESLQCTNNEPPTHHDFEQQPSDVVQSHHLEVNRAFSAGAHLELSVCNADVRVEARPDTQELRVLVNTAGRESRAVQDYVQTLRVDQNHGVVLLKLPKGSNATVLVQVPMGVGSKTEMSIGRGDLDFQGSRAAGDREINVGMGDARLALGGVSSYAHLEANVGLGAFHDRRQGGRSGYFASSRESDGTGQGSLEVNVGMGTLNIVN